jgi:hypothetical protein
MNEIMENKKACEAIRSSINATFDRLLLTLDGKADGETGDLQAERIYPLAADTNIFIGKRPAAVLFGEERIEADNWRKVYAAIISRCNADTQCHDNLMYLRDKVAGRDRILLSRSPDGMRRPLKIGEDMYAEACYGTATLPYILRDRILAPASFDCSGISIAIRT